MPQNIKKKTSIFKIYFSSKKMLSILLIVIAVYISLSIFSFAFMPWNKHTINIWLAIFAPALVILTIGYIGFILSMAGEIIKIVANSSLKIFRRKNLAYLPLTREELKDKNIITMYDYLLFLDELLRPNLGSHVKIPEEIIDRMNEDFHAFAEYKNRFTRYYDAYKIEFNFGLLKDIYGESFSDHESISLVGEKILRVYSENECSGVILSLDLMYDHPKLYDNQTKKLLKSIELEKLFDNKGLLLDLNDFEKLSKMF
jgi:hypothetical protein